MPLMVFPPIIKVPPFAIVVFWPMLPVNQMPPTLLLPLTLGWLENVLLNIALSPAEGGVAAPVSVDVPAGAGTTVPGFVSGERATRRGQEAKEAPTKASKSTRNVRK